jgi:hypothetical protein
VVLLLSALVSWLSHILSKDNTQGSSQTRYQLNSHLQSNTLELDDKAQTLSYEHYYPYGGTAIIAGKDKTKVQQKRYRYTGKERNKVLACCFSCLVERSSKGRYFLWLCA